MGNQCCEEVRNNNQQQVILEITKNQKVDNKDIVVEIAHGPQVSQKIRNYLQNIKPFADKLNPKSKIFRIGNRVYKGQLNQNILPTGYGNMYLPNGALYIGRFQNGVANGPAHYIWPNGAYFCGFVKNNKADDQNAIYQCQDYRYSGSIINNNFDFGTITANDGKYKFVRFFQQGRKKKGKLTWKQTQSKSLPLSNSQTQYQNQYIYEGQFDQNENFTGFGILITPKGIYNGEFKNNMKNGKGIFDYSNGLRYEGYYKDDIKQGTGIIINKNKNIAFQGQFRNGLPDGKGKAPGPDGKLYELEWNEGISSVIQDNAIKQNK